MGWVTDRHRCTLAIAWAELRDAIGRDVEEANGLLSAERRNCAPFQIEEKGRRVSEFVVTGHPIKADAYSPSYSIWFELADDQILISRTGPQTLPELPDLTVKQRWNAASGTCVLNLDGKEVDVEAISQIALEPVFFGV